MARANYYRVADMNVENGQNGIDTEAEPGEYSSPACFMHEFSVADNAADRIVIYHNPACSKSRATLALIQASGAQPQIVEYLKTPPSATELRTIVQKLNMSPAALVRTGEAIFKQKYLGKQMSDAQWLAAMVADPILMERPIVVRGAAAAIGRPPENVQRLLSNLGKAQPE
jgi:arsenate reductase